MRTSVFVGTSLDGFIARRNGTYDFLPTDGGEPHGYDEFIATVDVLVIGRHTFETVLAFPEWPYGTKQVIVLSSRPLDLSTVGGGRVEQMSGSPAEIAAQLSQRGFKHAYIDGGITVQRFLSAGLIHRITITRVPVLIGDGIPLFGSLSHDVQLRHISTQAYKSGLVKSEYEVLQGSNLVNYVGDSRPRLSGGAELSRRCDGPLLSFLHLHGPSTMANAKPS